MGYGLLVVLLYVMHVLGVGGDIFVCFGFGLCLLCVCCVYYSIKNVNVFSLLVKISKVILFSIFVLWLICCVILDLVM